MRNPIFAHNTLFTDAATGAIPGRYTCGETRELRDGSRIIRLETDQPLVRVRTASGIILDMSPESAFSLGKNSEGDVMRWQPVFNPSAHNLDPTITDLPSTYPMTGSQEEWLARLFIAGLICGAGTHSTARSRATSVILPVDLAAHVESRILDYVETLVERKHLHAYSMRHSAIDMHDGAYYLRSRVLTYMCSELLSEHLQQPTSILRDMLEDNVTGQFVFFRGLISSLTRREGKLAFYNRDADVVEWVGDTLWNTFGVPVTVHVDPMEPVIQPGKNSARPHHLEIDANGIYYAVAAGLRDGVYFPSYLFRPVPDPIVSVTPLDGRRPAVIVIPGRSLDRDYPITANGLIFNAAFTMPAGIESIASHPSLVNDPAYF